MKKKLLYKNLLIIIFCDAALLIFLWYLSHALRFNFEIPSSHFATMIEILPFVIITKLFVFHFFDLYRGMWRYTSIQDLINILKASFISSIFIVGSILFFTKFTGYARSVFVIDLLLTILFVSASRLWVRLFLGIFNNDLSLSENIKMIWHQFFSKKSGGKNIIIIGAGDCGEKIFREIKDNKRLSLNVVGFLDDDPQKIGKKIHGRKVFGKSAELVPLSKKNGIDEIIIAIPSITSQQMRRIVGYCEESKIKYKTVPSMGELINGNVTINAVRDVAYRDLLGREVVKLDKQKIGAYISRRRILVTGAGGSIGSELCRQICQFNPEKIILYERSESPLYEIELELKKKFPYINVIPVLGDIRDRRQLNNAFERTRPDVVFHTAAYKHVPMMELQPWKAVKNNILGTRNLVDISKMHNIHKFVFVSTDKAVRPTNVMGASKRCAELIVQGQNAQTQNEKCFITVRFGNVVGSIGSVVPLFKKQIAEGGPVTVTHPEVTRYFMTIPEACQLILQAGTMGEGGEIFLLDMGDPIRIVDIARDLIKLSGFEPDVDIAIEFIGLRPGEKLYEELINDSENIIQTSHEKIMILKGGIKDQKLLNEKIDELAKTAYEQDGNRIKKTLKEIIPEYEPQFCETVCYGDSEKRPLNSSNPSLPSLKVIG